jgi:hypothetical protein
MFIPLAGLFGFGSGGKIGAPPPPAIAIQRKLTNEQNPSAGLLNIQIHPSGGILKNPQMSDFVRQVRCIGRCIIRTYPDKYQKPFLNLPAHLSIYAADSSQNPLNHGTHFVLPMKKLPDRISNCKGRNKPRPKRSLENGPAAGYEPFG